MELELTIRGNAAELAPILDLLKNNGSGVEIAATSFFESDVPVSFEWLEVTRQSFWDSLTANGKELMSHLAIYSPYEADCRENNCQDAREYYGMCFDYEHRRKASGVTPEEFQKHLGWSLQAFGGRLASINRKLSLPAYKELPHPIKRVASPAIATSSAADSLDDISHSDPYVITPEWGVFIAKMCEVAYSNSHPSEMDTSLDDLPF